MRGERILDHISYHVVYDSSILDSIEFASKNGFSGVQIAIESPHLSFENINPKEILEIREKSKKLGINITLHGPDDVASLMNINPSIRKGILSYYASLFEFAKKINANLVTIHAGAPAIFPTDATPSEIFPKNDTQYYKKAFEENLKDVIKLAQGKTHVCIENYLLYDFVLEVIQKHVSRNEISLCWDIPKIYNKDGSVNQEIMNFFMKNLSAVRQVHLHSIRDGHSHKVIKPGFIDFRYYFNLLKDVDVWDYCIEVRPREKAVESLKNLNKILLKS
jgi:sugar phosphate isomerase/epimerase